MRAPTVALFNREVDGLSTGGRLYARSYLQIRLLIGLTGFLLPLLLVVIDWLFITSGRQVQGSMSAYYHTPARDVFVAGLSIVGALLLTYMTAQVWTWDFILSSVAGVAVLVVAFFPTWRAGLVAGSPHCGDTASTPTGCTALQQTLGEGHVAMIHGVAASIFVAMLCGLCFVFAAREKRYRGHTTRRALYMGCAAVIVLASGWAYFGPTLHLFAYDLGKVYVGEVFAFYAFSLSWFASSWDLIRGFLRRVPSRPSPMPVSLDPAMSPGGRPLDG
jgi:hypothetical protein